MLAASPSRPTWGCCWSGPRSGAGSGWRGWPWALQGVGPLHACKEREGSAAAFGGALPVSRRVLQLELAGEGQLEAAERGRVCPMDGGGRGNGSAPHAFGVGTAGSGCSLSWSREHVPGGTLGCADLPAKEEDTGKMETRRKNLAAVRHESELAGEQTHEHRCNSPHSPVQQQRPRST